MTHLSNEIYELSSDQLDAVIGGGTTTVLPQEKIHAHFLSIHERWRMAGIRRMLLK